MSLIGRLKNALVDIIFPPICAVCRATVSDLRKTYNLCAECEEKIHLKTGFECAVCGARLPEGKKICHRETPYILAASAKYEDKNLQRLIWQLKYQNQTASARPLVHLMTRYWLELGIKFENALIIPIPLHRRRLKSRGFNQAELLARRFAKKVGFPINTSLLRRVRYLKPQAECKNREERALNIQNCFQVKNSGLVSGKTIILVDDVTTSGATLLEAANVIKKAGSKNIIALVAARA